jgi:metal-responsive CopG/Arc/MetJ family transcriptional regulator
MQTIQVVVDDDLLRAADRAARRVRLNRSALIREALRRHLEWMANRELERRERESYQKHPDSRNDVWRWERVASWPED